MINLSPASAFVPRYKGALIVVAFSFFFLAIALTGRALGDGMRATDAVLVLIELIFGFAAAIFALRFGREPIKSKLPVITLLTTAVVFHFWLIVVHVGFSTCPFGVAFCAAVSYAYLAILGLMAVLLFLTTPANSSSTG